MGWGFGYWEPDDETRTERPAPPYYKRFKEYTVCRGNLIEGNHVHHVMQRLHDGAGIYTLGHQRDTMIRGNYIHDNIGTGISGFDSISPSNPEYESMLNRVVSEKGFPGGIYMDEASGGMTVEENLVHNVVLPFFYHDVGITGRFLSNRIGENYWNIRPGQEGFPQEIADKAGIDKDQLFRTDM